MREIKFRIWGKKERAMFFYEKDWDCVDESLFSISNSKIIQNGEEYDWWDQGTKLDKDNAILMQYTGLKDKNGSEIYEGDIVKREDRAICKIIYREDHARFEFYRESKIGTHYNGLNYQCEVIGNIYENPELLKEGDKL